MWGKELCRYQGQWRRRGKQCSRHRSRDSPAAYDEDHGEAGCPPPDHGGPRWSRCPPAAHGGPHTRPGECPKEAVNPWRARAGAVCSWRTAPCGRDSRWSSLWRTAAHCKDPLWRSLCRTVSHGRDPILEQGKTVRRKQWQRQRVTNWPQPPFPIPLCRSGGRGKVNCKWS